MGKATELHDYILSQITWDWQDSAPIIRRAMPRVPPGKALRKYQMYVKAETEKRGRGYRSPKSLNRTTEDQIRFGQRMLVNQTLGSMASPSGSQILELRGPRTARQVRRKERRKAVTGLSDRAKITERVIAA